MEGLLVAYACVNVYVYVCVCVCECYCIYAHTVSFYQTLNH